MEIDFSNFKEHFRLMFLRLSDVQGMGVIKIIYYDI